MVDNRDNNVESRIVDAAHHIFQSKGFDGARMQEIADLASINKAMLHYYFRSKEKLFEVVFFSALSVFGHKLNELFNSDVVLEEKIKRLVKYYITEFNNKRFVVAFIFNEMNKNPNFVLKLAAHPNRPHPKNFIEQLDQDFKKNHIQHITGKHFFVNLVSLCLFPFIAAPMIKVMIEMDAKNFDDFINQREQIITHTLLKLLETEK